VLHLSEHTSGLAESSRFLPKSKGKEKLESCTFAQLANLRIELVSIHSWSGSAMPCRLNKVVRHAKTFLANEQIDRKLLDFNCVSLGLFH
jgi:hypothetical protein